MAGARVLSVNVGRPAPNRSGRDGMSGIDKHPVGAVAVRDPGPKQGGEGSGVVGDAVIERRHHGGTHQAVYVLASEELAHWAGEFGRELRPGVFGENVTTADLDVDAAVVGTRWAIGDDVVLEVAGPRIPCATFAAQMGERAWVRRFAERGRTGAYCAVVVPGTIRPDDRVRVREVPEHGVDLVTVFRALMGDIGRARRVLEADAVPHERPAFERVLRRA